MARQKTPLSKARLTGADRVNPGRFRDRKDPELSGKDIGEPLDWLSKDAKSAWREIVKTLPWLVYEDRLAVAHTAGMLAQYTKLINNGKPLQASFMSELRASLGNLGASPTDRSKVTDGKRGGVNNDNPFMQFAGRH